MYAAYLYDVTLALGSSLDCLLECLNVKCHFCRKITSSRIASELYSLRDSIREVLATWIENV